MRRACIAFALVLAAGAALAAIPSSTKVAGAVAEANDLAGRSGPLLLTVSLRVAGAGPAANGELATHPTGLARLELQSPQGFVERHLLLGDEYSASRDGELLDDPHPFLPPVFLLQATTGATLSAALTSFGVQAEQVVLGRMGDHDCLVFGGRDVSAALESRRLLPSLWIDLTSYDPLLLVRPDGTEYRLGPTQVYEGVRLPRWIDIEAQDSLRARLEIVRATRADAPAAVFQAEWLTAEAVRQPPNAPPASSPQPGLPDAPAGRRDVPPSP